MKNWAQIGAFPAPQVNVEPFFPLFQPPITTSTSSSLFSQVSLSGSFPGMGAWIQTPGFVPGWDFSSKPIDAAGLGGPKVTPSPARVSLNWTWG